ncbi:MAG: hypothetical protein MR278_10290 [Bacteroidales bacterium]|nr:hypothetical protein [Anaerotignum sp.]MCI5680344.1 hypothetical protein [Bacteroidales bacterium]MDY3926836.1 hypothetical protein [Anaerotignum sp.]
MKYIWINPVTESMYDPEILSAFLQKKGYETVTVSTDWANIVKGKYQDAVASASLPVVDMRCPKILGLLEKIGIPSSVTIPEIEPILIHCGREISQREDLRGTEKIITTPCKALADMGNALCLPETTFLPWNEFLCITGSTLAAVPPKKSPIPPGFFEDLGFSCRSITGEKEIRELFQNQTFETDLLELLFCEDGCHNGDGITGCAD